MKHTLQSRITCCSTVFQRYNMRKNFLNISNFVFVCFSTVKTWYTAPLNHIWWRHVYSLVRTNQFSSPSHLQLSWGKAISPWPQSWTGHPCTPLLLYRKASNNSHIYQELIRGIGWDGQRTQQLQQNTVNNSGARTALAWEDVISYWPHLSTNMKET